MDAVHTTKLDPWNTEIVLDVSFHWSHSGEFELELQRTKKAVGQVEDHMEEYGHARDKNKEPVHPELSDGKEGRIYLRILISLREACEAYLARDVMDLV